MGLCISENKNPTDLSNESGTQILDRLKGSYLVSSKQLNPSEDPSLMLLGKYFELYRMDMNPEIFKFYLDILGSDTEKLINLKFNSIKLDTDQAKFLGIGLSYCLQLEILDLSNCNLDDQGLTCVVKGFANVPGLSRLNLAQNRFGSIGISYLLRGFRYTHVLEYLDLSGNRVLEVDVSIIGKILETCTFLCVVKLEGLVCEDKVIEKLNEFRSIFKSKSFYISGNTNV